MAICATTFVHMCILQGTNNLSQGLPASRFCAVGACNEQISIYRTNLYNAALNKALII